MYVVMYHVILWMLYIMRDCWSLYMLADLHAGMTKILLYTVDFKRDFLVQKSVTCLICYIYSLQIQSFTPISYTYPSVTAATVSGRCWTQIDKPHLIP